MWPALRPGGRPAAVGAALLGLSNYGLGDLFAPFGRLPCSRAEPGCDAASQLTDVDGVVHNVLGATGLLLVVAAAPVLGIAMRRTPGWERWAPWAFGFAALFFAMAVGTGLAGSIGLTGAAERVLATTGAAAVAVLALAVRRKASREP